MNPIETSLDWDRAELALAGEKFISSLSAELIAAGESEQDAKDAAMEEWQVRRKAMAPDCKNCVAHSVNIDPYGTGDSPTLIECNAFSCPWGKVP